MYKFRTILQNYFTQDEIDKISQTKILLIGCGGLGSNIANVLVRTGFSYFILIDYDRVEIKNLNRQIFWQEQYGEKKVLALKKNLLKINSSAQIKIIHKKIDKEDLKQIILKESPDVIIEAVDDEMTKKFIFEITLKYGKKVVCASGIAGYGDCDNIKIRRGRNFVIVGDMKKSIKDYKPLAPKVTAVAAIQADEVLRMVLDDVKEKKIK
ncbi:MAG: sulfur carrier protein ThiS adenylyltransferase ThiF [Candidatus Goldbacteria bacterium]|nr:sulfur carrier protein ThiS adenylyltransferase ThiF [Candidatus Goldiibacteriota bacterium]